MYTLRVDTAPVCHYSYLIFSIWTADWKQWAAFYFKAGYVNKYIAVAGGLLGMLQ